MTRVTDHSGHAKTVSILDLLKAAAPKPTRHPGSKPGYTHLTISSQRGTLYARADGVPAPGQKCLPPHAKARQPLETIRPLSSADRMENYGTTDKDRLTPAQRRRTEHKLGHALRDGRPRPVTFADVALHKTPAGTPQPRSGLWSRGFVKMLGRLKGADRDRAIIAKARAQVRVR